MENEEIQEVVIAVHNLLNEVSIQGGSNVVAMYKVFAILESTLVRLQEEEKANKDAKEGG